jgi:hypothetical protein
MERMIRAIVILAVVGAGAYFAYHYLESRYQKELQSAVEQEQNKRLAVEDKLESRIAELEKELAEYKPPPLSPEKMAEAFGEAPTTVEPEVETVDCKELQKKTTSFFAYIAGRKYMDDFQAEKNTRDLFRQMVEELTKRRPVVVGEMKDLSSLINNVAHFYRVLGEDRIKLIVTIFDKESFLMEDAMANFYEWASLCSECEQMETPCPSIEVLYQYAGFFLNTLAGRSYLLRRDSKVRTLTTYYSVLILDRANDKSLNPHGIDIRPFITLSLYEAASVKGLTYQNRYLGKLQALRDKYQMLDSGDVRDTGKL